MKKLAVGTAILAAAAIAFAGGDVWKAKSMDQWTDKDINEILATSPWAKAGVVPQGASTRPDGMPRPPAVRGLQAANRTQPTSLQALTPSRTGPPKNRTRLPRMRLPTAYSGGPRGPYARLRCAAPS